MTVFAFTHSEAVETRQRLKNLERHGLRVDLLARENLRPGAVAGAGLDWPNFDGRRLTKAYADFKKRNDVDPRKGAQLLHSIGIGVSPSWIREKGDLHDPKNPRNIQLFATAIAWVRSFAGDNAIVSARMDLDEEGGGWVDVYFAPIRQQKYKGRSQTKSIISVNMCLEETAIGLGYPKGSHYAALNTGWAKYAQRHLDPAIERGKPGRDTGKEHLTPRQYKAEQEALKNAKSAKAAELAALNKAQSYDETTRTLAEIFDDPSLELLLPRPAVGSWQVPKSITAKVKKPGVLMGELFRILEVFAAKMAEVRQRLDAIIRREQQLDQVIGELAQVRHRLKIEDAQALDRARAVVRPSEEPAPMEDPSPW